MEGEQKHYDTTHETTWSMESWYCGIVSVKPSKSLHRLVGHRITIVFFDRHRRYNIPRGTPSAGALSTRASHDPAQVVVQAAWRPCISFRRKLPAGRDAATGEEST